MGSCVRNDVEESPVTGDCHAGICGSRGVRFPPATRLVEVDLVGEDGNPFGEFCFTLTMTEVATGSTVNRSIKNKAAAHVNEAIEFARRLFRFPILGIDSDMGRRRDHLHPFASGEQERRAHVEQKNWTHIRELVGYLRFDTPEELEILKAIWILDAHPCYRRNSLRTTVVFSARIFADRVDSAASLKTA
jgi:hypothetical protein